MRIYLFVIKIMIVSLWMIVNKGYSQCCAPTTMNLVVNGGFELQDCAAEGTVSTFESDMTRQCTGASWGIATHNNGLYAIAGSAASIQSQWSGTAHSGTRYFVGDGLWGVVGVRNVAWSQYISVEAGKTYQFSIFCYSENLGGSVSLGFNNDDPVVFSNIDIQGSWQRLCATYTATSNGLVTAKIYKSSLLSGQYMNNDFGLDDIEFRELPPFEIADKPDVMICWGQSVTLSAEVLVGSGNYTYSWSSGQNTSSISVSPTEVTDYYVSVKDLVNGCIRTDKIRVNVIKLNLNLGQDLKICLTAPTIIKAEPNGGSGNYSYNWSDGHTSQLITKNYNEAGTYSVLVTDNVYGCTVQDEITAVAWQCPGTQYYQNTETLPTLSYYNTIIAGSAVTGGAQGPVKVKNGQNVTFKGGQSIELQPGFSTETGAVFLAYIEPGCSFGQLIINKTNLPQCQYVLSATPLYGSGNYSYTWSTGATTRDITVGPATTTTYSVTVTDNCLGNTGTASYTLEPHYIGVMNATVTDLVTPNGDGHNDTWVVTDNGKQQYAFDASFFYLLIVNRWNDIVWQLSGNVNSKETGFAEGDIYWPANDVSDGTYWAYLTLQNCLYNQQYTTWIHVLSSSGSRIGITEEMEDTASLYNNMENVNLTNIRISPNPSKGEFRIEVPGGNGYYLYVEDIYGKIVYEKQQEQNVSEIGLKELKSGLYYLKARSNGQIYSSKIIISD